MPFSSVDFCDFSPMSKRKANVPIESDVADTEAPKGVRFEKVQGVDLSIKKVKTSKDEIEQPALAKDKKMIIPPLGSSIIINGKSGSGKSTLLANYITGPQFFGPSQDRPKGWFDEIFLFSPTASGDDVQQSLNIKKHHVYTDLDEGPELLRVILGSQKTALEGGNKAHKVGQYAVIFDDVIGDTKFMNSKEFLQTFYMVRHANCTTFICSQHYKRVPKVCRQQAGFVHFFAGSAQEVDTIVEDFAPPMYTKKEFKAIVNSATHNPHDFLTVNMKVGWEYRFRRNLDEFIILDRLAPEDKKENQEKEEANEKQMLHFEASSRENFSAQEEKSFRESLKTAVAYYKSKHEQNEQARRVLSERENPRVGGRIVQEKH